MVRRCANLCYDCFSALSILFLFFNPPATTEIYTLSLHDALPISRPPGQRLAGDDQPREPCGRALDQLPHVCPGDRKSTRLNSSHANISYAVFCLKKKKHSAWGSPP